MGSYLQANARKRLHGLFDADSFAEMLGPDAAVISPHLQLFGIVPAADDGVIIGRARLAGQAVLCAAQDGRFLGGAVGEVHGAKLAGLLRLAAIERPAAVVLLCDSGGVRLQEANAGLIAIAEWMRAQFDLRASGIPCIVLAGGANGCFGGAGIAACCANAVIMSAEGRLAMSGPEVIASACGSGEYDPADRDLVWRTSGGKHRYLLGDCTQLVADDIQAFRAATVDALTSLQTQNAALSLDELEAEHALLTDRLQRFHTARDPVEVWAALGIAAPEDLPALDTDRFLAAVHGHRTERT